MKLTYKNFYSIITKNYIFENKPSIAVAVSGGPDSMALLFLLNHWIKKKKGKIIALFVDHKIRSESYNENLKMQLYLQKHKIESIMLRVSKNKLLKYNMAEARNNRYILMTNYCRKKNILHLFVGHHFDDNLETFITRKISGSSIEGLMSISNIILRNNIQILRPLLNFSKKKILDFNLSNRIYYINDPSNSDKKYSRVNIRAYLQNINKKKIIKKDFLQIRKYGNLYKKMIFEITIKNILKINSNHIILDYENFIKNEKLVVEKIIQNFFSFFYPNKNKLRSSKTEKMINELLDQKITFYNLGGLNIKKNGNFLIFFSKK
ncbi:MAG: tRNA lysidine(34) synthetase TilS [Pelagibacteraceae bacterium]|nr:tRNA lysidine(34) synthetase TilS [Pelagibacteraceae bacterium]|tara:strand:+ start:21021 stop:21983 length:963 start_codon:yes stop_codon:yes gene_type:complete